MKRAVQDIYPLSPTQQGLLFHSLYGNSQAGAYIVQVSYLLQGALNPAAFEQAWQQLIQRHTILRTAFAWDNLAAPVQVVGQQAILPIHWQDWQSFSVQQQSEKFSQLLTADRRQGFSLTKAPLMRIQAIQLSPNRYRILWTHHHILLDGWSLPLLLKEWITCYYLANASSGAFSGASSGAFEGAASLNPSVADLSVVDSLVDSLGLAYPYRDYIAWLQQQDLAMAKQFWQKRLAGITAPTPLGIDQRQHDRDSNNRDSNNRDSNSRSIADPSLSVGSLEQPQNAFEAQHHQLSYDLNKQLQSFAMQHRLTLSSLVQGAWAKVLSVYSGESDVLYGLACAGRPSSLPAADKRVGLFINTLPMRVQVNSDTQLLPWLQQIQAQQLAQQPYEYTPLVDIQAVSDIPGRSPLFESIVVFENYPLEVVQGIAGLELLEVSVTEQTHYPLTLFATAKDGLSFKVLYDAQRFSKGAIARLLGHLQTALSSMVAFPQETLAGISILPKAEAQQLLCYGNGDYKPLSNQCIPDAIAQYALNRPDATAIIFEGNRLSYGQLNLRVNQLSHYLQQTGIAAGTPIGICIERSIDMMVALLAILKIGCAYVPLDAAYPMARQQYVIEDAGLEWMLCHEATAHIFESIEQPLQLINLARQTTKISACATTYFKPTSTASTNLAYLIYTSGSTGKPKGVPITHQSLNNLLAAMASRLQIKSTDTLMAVTTLAFDIAALELFLPLSAGGTLLLASHETVRNSHQLIAYLDSYGVDIMQATPATWRMLLSSGWAGQNSLKILCGGEALDVSLANQLLNCGEEVWNVYGPTETTIWSGALALTKDMLARGSVPIGQPIDNTQFYVLDGRQRPVPIGVAGELYIGGLGVSPGYWHREDLTAERFVSVHSSIFYKTGISYDADIPSETGILYRTGDRVRYREDGTLDYLGRLDYQTKLRGYRIELGEIEAAISTHRHINQAIVVLQGDRAENQRLVAYVMLSSWEDQPVENRENMAEVLRSHLSTQIPHYMIPSAYQVLVNFPLTPNGKIDRNALSVISPAAAILDHRLKTDLVTDPITDPITDPKSAVESTLAEIWQSILPLETVGLHDNFFEIGGHSLLVITAQSQIRQRLGVELPMVDLFRYPTLYTLAVHINQLGQQSEQAQEKQAKRAIALTAGKQRLKQRRIQRQSADRESTNCESGDRIGGSA